MSNLSTEQLDQIFNGAGAVLTGVQAVSSAVGGAINEVQNAFDGSRRNAFGSNNFYTQPNQQGYQPLPQYGYGYDEPTQYSPYGYPSTMGGMQSGQQGTNCYQGFTNPMYGTTAGPVPYSSFNGTGGLDFPKGGSWGW